MEVDPHTNPIHMHIPQWSRAPEPIKRRTPSLCWVAVGCLGCVVVGIGIGLSVLTSPTTSLHSGSFDVVLTESGGGNTSQSPIEEAELRDGPSSRPTVTLPLATAKALACGWTKNNQTTGSFGVTNAACERNGMVVTRLDVQLDAVPYGLSAPCSQGQCTLYRQGSIQSLAGVKSCVWGMLKGEGCRFYGNHCGPGHGDAYTISTDVALDALDQTCLEHDLCADAWLGVRSIGASNWCICGQLLVDKMTEDKCVQPDLACSWWARRIGRCWVEDAVLDAKQTNCVLSMLTIRTVFKGMIRATCSDTVPLPVGGGRCLDHSSQLVDCAGGAAPQWLYHDVYRMYMANGRCAAAVGNGYEMRQCNQDDPAQRFLTIPSEFDAEFS